MPTNPDEINDLTKNDTVPGTNSGQSTQKSSMEVDEHLELSAVDQLLKKIDTAQSRLDEIHRNAGDIYTKEERLAADEASDAVEWLSKQVNAITKRADSKIRPVNLGEIPRFQVVGQAKHFPDLPRFSTVDHFFNAFENVIRASGNDVNLVWKQYIPISLPFDFDSRTKNDLLPCNDWEQAKALFRKHFGAPVNSEESMAKLFSMRMKGDDTLQGYTNRFMKYVKDCNFSPHSNMLAKFYQFTLLGRNKQMMVNQMSVRHGPDHKWTINEIYECVLPLFLVDEQNRGDHSSGDERRGKRRGDSGEAGTKTKMAKTSNHGYFCAKHGGSNATHNTADCRSNKLKLFGSDNRPNKATAAASSSGRPFSNICNFCNKPRTPGHTCQQFYDWKREREAKRNINVYTVQVERTGSSSSGSPASGSASGSGSFGSGSGLETLEDDKSSTDPVHEDTDEDVTMRDVDADLDAIDDEQASLECKFTVKNKHESFNPFQLLTPIILESKEGKPVRLVAKVDTGSDSTFLNKNVFHHKLLFTSQDIISVEGNLNFLSHSVKRLGKSPAIKIRYLNDISFDHSFELSNFIQDLGDFDVLLGVDTLSRLRIGLTGVAHKFADIGGLTDEEKSDLLETIDFENVNFDTKHSIDPETASIFESQTEADKYMSHIQDAIDENQKIKPGTFCNVPESEITIPIKENQGVVS